MGMLIELVEIVEAELAASKAEVERLVGVVAMSEIEISMSYEKTKEYRDGWKIQTAEVGRLRSLVEVAYRSGLRQGIISSAPEIPMDQKSVELRDAWIGDRWESFEALNPVKVQDNMEIPCTE